MGRNKRKVDKLIQYLKDDRPKKFKSCAEKYNIDLRHAAVPKGRTFLHYAAKFGTGSLIQYLLEHGVDASKPNQKGDLPLHVAIARALECDASETSEVYFDVVTPLLEAYPMALDADNQHGESGQELLKNLKQRIKKQSHHQSYGHDSTRSYPSPDSEWKEKLAQEFESESTDFFGRYHDCEDDFSQEREKETHDEWASRMWRDIHHRRQQQHYNTFHPSDRGRKRKHTPRETDSDADRSGGKKSTFEEELKKAREKMQEAYRLQEEREKKNQSKVKRTAYEANYQKVLADESGGLLGFKDIPWPSLGSVQTVTDVLFHDLGIKCKTALKKYVKQQQVRWHPDKFLQKFGERLEEGSRDKVLERVKEISQAVNSRAETLLAEDG